jgi:hypothetical protein
VLPEVRAYLHIEACRMKGWRLHQYNHSRHQYHHLLMLTCSIATSLSLSLPKVMTERRSKVSHALSTRAPSLITLMSMNT